MKAQHASLWFLGAVFFLCSVHTRGLRRCLISMDMHHIEESFREIKGAIQAKDIFQNVTILSTSEILSSVKPLGVCCMTKNLLAFYMDRVFKDHQELNPQILRKISSIANSFLYMQKALQQCQEQRLCHCGQEATNATRIIHDNYNQLEVQSAALKSLGELDIFLAWIHKNHQGTSTA
ncbi:interleukin-19 isoform X1 [Rousettus aegyptiacus]|nr:interleukin-19 isoform X1 [Rousettus aegyptiacus]XP_015984764.1 interleukin-19 isoform X1 [Rousettus aegyptiacus]XP_015984765.1 interleukin-19 isoform X1 [Rousettus aegyptiacus]XP_036090343.1 interleukin-19 isoform X1 [Rousettus aegyptiacus]